MKKFIKKAIMLVLVCCAFTMLTISSKSVDPLVANASQSSSAVNYITDEFDVAITVTNRKQLRIKETITVDFTKKSHGIFRYIPIEGVIHYSDNGKNKTEKYRAQVTDISSNYTIDVQTVTSNAGIECKMIRIGDANVELFGKVTYVINYKLLIPELKNLGYQTLYCNIFPNENEAPITKAVFSINYSEEFKSNDYQFYLGNQKVSDTTEGITIRKTANSIGGTLTGVNLNNGFSLVHNLEDGFFKVNDTPIVLFCIYTLIGLLLIGVVVALWLKFGRDEKTFVSVEVRPPKNMNPSEAGYLVDGSVENKDLIALFFYWANDGIITISELGEDDFKFTKLRGLYSGKSYEQTMFSCLFGEGDITTLSALEGKYYLAINSAKTQLQGYMESKKETQVYDKKSIKIQAISIFLAALPVFLAVLGARLSDSYEFLPSFMPAIIVFGVYVAISGGLVLINKINSKFLLIIPFVLLIAGGVYCFMATYNTFGQMIVVVDLCCSAVITIFAFIMRKKTTENVKIRGQLLGLKKYINKVEKEQLIKFVKEDPSYYYDILPYAYVLGVSDVWAKNFEGIAVQPASWYTSYNGSMLTNMILFSHMNRCLNQMNTFHTTDMNKAITDKMNSMGGGSGDGFHGGGGGFSGGGGFGGGGMGSW